MIKHEEKYIMYFERECVFAHVEVQFELDPFVFFFVLGLGLCLYDYCNDFD